MKVRINFFTDGQFQPLDFVTEMNKDIKLGVKTSVSHQKNRKKLFKSGELCSFAADNHNSITK